MSEVFIPNSPLSVNALCKAGTTPPATAPAVQPNSFGVVDVTQPGGANTAYVVTLLNPIAPTQRIPTATLIQSGSVAAGSVGIKVDEFAGSSTTVVVQVLDAAGALLDGEFSLAVIRTTPTGA